ncbi:protein toll-like isoform 2-T3 [Cochliomyia hominivorax]
MTHLTSYIYFYFLITLQFISLNKSAQIHKAEVKIIVHYNVYIKIECFNIMEYNEFRRQIFELKYNNRNETDTLKIYNCPMPDDGSSLGVMLRELGIISYSHLWIKNNESAPKQLSKQQLSNFQGVRILTIQFKHLSQLPSNLFADQTLKNLTHLNLNTNITKLPKNLFENLENLICLDINHNLQILNNGQFQKQRNLKKLNLSNNKLISIDSNIFPNKALIEAIKLENNLLQTLPEEIFVNLPNLSKIDINQNEFRELPAKLFRYNNQLQEFILRENRFEILKFPEEFLAYMFVLKTVKIKCGLEFLPDNLFYYSTYIKEIILNHNKLKSLPRDLFEYQEELMYLDLSYNYLETISSGLFRNTKKLTTLLLTKNRLRAVESNSFSNLENLRSLDLSHNQLVHQNFRINLETNIALQQLFLQNNSFSELHILHGKLPRYLKLLNLSYNKIRLLSAKNLELLYTDHLKLNLSHNQIQTINLQDFGKYGHHYEEIQYIFTDLNENPLKCYCEILESMKYLNGSENHLKFNIDNLICSNPQQIRGKQLKYINEKELLCSIESKYLESYECPNQCDCWLRLYDKILMVNCANKNLTRVPNLMSIRNFNFKGTELNLTNNKIFFLPDIYRTNSEGYAECTKLFLNNNNLEEIKSNQIPRNVSYLDLSENYLQYLNEDTLIFLNSSKSLVNIILAKNKWLCDCDKFAMMSHLNLKKFVDIPKLTCNNYPGTRLLRELSDLCNKRKIIEIIIICASVIAILLIIALYYKYKQYIDILIYNLCPRFIRIYDYDDDDNEDKLYDAFICYSHKDEDFIANYIVPELENGYPPFKLCVHVRDFIVGDYIMDQIVRSIANSKRTIIILSQNFIESEWAKMEFKESYRATLRERRSKIIAIMYEDIGDLSNLDKDLKIYLKMNSYLKWGDPQFWQKLRYAMPHK